MSAIALEYYVPLPRIVSKIKRCLVVESNKSLHLAMCTSIDVPPQHLHMVE